MANNLINLRNSKGQLVTLTDEMIIEKTDEFVNDIQLPETYNYKKAIKSFCLALPDVKGIENATPRSIFMAAQNYASRNLDISKNQCALIVYGDKLTLQKQYQGNVALAKKSNPHIVDITSNAIYEGDKIEIVKKDGRTEVKHETNFNNLNNELIGAYATVIYDDKTTDSEIMTRKSLEMSWSMSKAGTNVHKKFPEQMARKTVLNRLCLSIINSSIDGESPDFVKDEIDQYEEKENVNTNPNIDYENAIEMPEFDIQDKSDDLEENDKDESNEDVMESVKAKTQEILNNLGIENQHIEKDNEVDEVLARFESIKNSQEEPKVEEAKIQDGNHCQKCGKELSATSVGYYDKHPELARLCYSCNKKEGNI